MIQPTTNINTPSIASVATALPANPNRIGWSIQNLGTNVLFVNLGGTASSTVFHVALQVGTGTDDGKGGMFAQLSGAVFTGEITVAGTSPRYTVMEMAP